MPKTQAFEHYVSDYERWFERHPAVYHSELLALQGLLPSPGIGVEIGSGSGRFALPLGIALGIEPAAAMARLAQARGMTVIAAVAEALPFADNYLDYVLMVTTLCFVDDMQQSLAEVYRVLRPGGAIVIGFVDRDSPVGRDYLAHQAQHRFYREAKFHSTAEIAQTLRDLGFTEPCYRQTLLRPLADISHIDSVRPGHGQGSFVVLQTHKPVP